MSGSSSAVVGRRGASVAFPAGIVPADVDADDVGPLSRSVIQLHEAKIAVAASTSATRRGVTAGW
jgi:hypothetical protein